MRGEAKTEKKEDEEKERKERQLQKHCLRARQLF